MPGRLGRTATPSSAPVCTDRMRSGALRARDGCVKAMQWLADSNTFALTTFLDTSTRSSVTAPTIFYDRFDSVRAVARIGISALDSVARDRLGKAAFDQRIARLTCEPGGKFP